MDCSNSNGISNGYCGFGDYGEANMGESTECPEDTEFCAITVIGDLEDEYRMVFRTCGPADIPEPLISATVSISSVTRTEYISKSEAKTNFLSRNYQEFED